MYSVLVVDKKKQMYSIYKNMLHWKQYGFEIIAFANSEKEALAFCQEYHYDLIITDLILKEGSGLSLIKELKAIQPCNIIVCTYENDFHVIRSAWRNGIQDYLLKSNLKSSQFIENLEMLHATFHKQHNSVKHTWKEELQKCLGLLRDHQFVDKHDFLQILTTTDIISLTTDYRLLYVRLDKAKDNFWNQKIQDRLKLQRHIQSSLSTMFPDILDIQILFPKKHAAVVILPAVSDNDMHAYATALLANLLEATGFSFSIAISAIAHGYESFYDLYKGVCDFIAQKFYSGSQSIIDITKPIQFQELHYGNVQFHNEIMSNMNMHNRNHVFQSIDHSIQYMKDFQIHPDQVLRYYKMIINNIENHELQSSARDSEQMFDEIRVKFKLVEDIDMMELFFKHMVDTIMSWMYQTTQRKYKQAILDIMQFIDYHLVQKITLDMIATNMKLSSVHISRLFKEQTGKNISEYINEQRMNKAVALLANRKLKIKEIAAMVGIDDQFYFNKVFKKYFKMSPRDYRNQM